MRWSLNHTHTKTTSCPCSSSSCFVLSVHWCFVFLSPLFCLWSLFLLRLLSPHAGSRGSDSPPSYHWLSTQLLGTASRWPSCSSSLCFLLFLFHLHSLTHLFLPHTLSCLAPADVQFLCTCTQTVLPHPKPICVLLTVLLEKLESNLTKISTKNIICLSIHVYNIASVFVFSSWIVVFLLIPVF